MICVGGPFEAVIRLHSGELAVSVAAALCQDKSDHSKCRTLCAESNAFIIESHSMTWK